MFLKNDVRIPMNGDIFGDEGSFMVAPRGTYAELLNWDHPKHPGCALVEIKLLAGAHIFMYKGPINRELLDFPEAYLL